MHDAFCLVVQKKKRTRLSDMSTPKKGRKDRETHRPTNP